MRKKTGENTEIGKRKINWKHGNRQRKDWREGRMEQKNKNEGKDFIRNRMKHMRRSLPPEQNLLFSTRICERLLSMNEIRQAETVLLYAAVRGEADPGYLVRALSAASEEQPARKELSASLDSSLREKASGSEKCSFLENAAVTGKTLAYPRVCGNEMDFYEIRSAMELVPGAFGIPEPAEGTRLLHPAANAVILVPGVAFMKNGNRIGMGRGYYDRYLAQYPNLLKIGVAYEAQMEAVWEPDERDLPMDIIVTENQVIYCKC